ncbi:MAG: nicotinate (nicotinamide) nucleotide adenylyltransferase, partial [Clostridia bacterium]|nr:nicotinate (nicotinamide) nucleotide adenylyltransferase [Clostridia bacterium]
MKKVGLYGGTFNPPHIEHINIVKNVIKELDLDLLIVMPTYVSPHKIGAEVADKSMRFEMLSLAFKNDSKVLVSDYEISKQDVSYTYLTIEHIKKEYKGSELYFIVGSDMLENFPKWKNPNVIAKNVNMVLVERPFDKINTQKIIKIYENLYNKPVLVTKYLGQNVSSTDIRIKAKLDLDFSSDTSQEIYDYIIKNDVYKKDEYYSYVCNALPLKRRKHTYGVIITAIRLAKKLGADVKKCELSALLHDVAKYKDYKDYSNFELESDVPKSVEHQFLGEHIIKTELSISDEDILNSVKYHT